jgi:oligopeptide/dipeptide ABC transporter ATP-binding protein
MNLLEVKNLKKYFPLRGGFFRRAVAHSKAVDGVSFNLEKGKTLGLVGESGCGKSTLGRAILRLHEPTAGQVLFQGVDVAKLGGDSLKAMRRHMQIIFQDPYASLSPRLTVHDILREPLDTHQIGTVSEREDKVMQLLKVVGLRSQVLNRYPHEFSGGQRQRIGIARALTLEPKFIVADEPVSALDVSVQAQVLNLISDLQKQFGISFLFIAHNLAVVQHISHDVAVMYLGRIVEKANAEDLYRDPKHPYTVALLGAIPSPSPDRPRQKIILKGDQPSVLAPPTGCPFHLRCPKVMPECSTNVPVLKDIGSNGKEHLVSCHLY